MTSATLARVEAHVFHAPIKEPVRTSFGTMSERVAVFVRIEDSDGARGWGEIWSNFPTASAEHRALLFADIVAPRALGKSLDDPAALWAEIDRGLHVLRVQSGDAGALSAAAAGLDLAIHDLRARKRGLPLWRALGGNDDGGRAGLRLGPQSRPRRAGHGRAHRGPRAIAPSRSRSASARRPTSARCGRSPGR